MLIGSFKSQQKGPFPSFWRAEPHPHPSCSGPAHQPAPHPLFSVCLSGVPPRFRDQGPTADSPEPLAPLFPYLLCLLLMREPESCWFCFFFKSCFVYVFWITRS